MNKFLKAIKRENKDRPPVWFMRQAGRYHSHYQALRKKHDFIELCKNSDLACEVTMGPIEDFGFDAAIMFSDLLFPLEAMGMGLEYAPGPTLAWHLKTEKDLDKLKGGKQLASQLSFQAETISKIKKRLSTSFPTQSSPTLSKEVSSEKGLLGFVGGPLTLFYYAAIGSHQNPANLAESQNSLLDDGRYDGFCEKLLDLLARNMADQYHAGADAVAIFDTAAGEISQTDFERKGVPVLKALLERFHQQAPNAPVVYYSRGTNKNFWKSLSSLPIHCLGVDWRTPITDVLKNFGNQWAIQGNIDPNWLLLDGSELREKLLEVFEQVQKLDLEYRKGWVCGLGHGVLPKVPESNVRLFIQLQKEVFGK